MRGVGRCEAQKRNSTMHYALTRWETTSESHGENVTCLRCDGALLKQSWTGTYPAISRLTWNSFVRGE